MTLLELVMQYCAEGWNESRVNSMSNTELLQLISDALEMEREETKRKFAQPR